MRGDSSSSVLWPGERARLRTGALQMSGCEAYPPHPTPTPHPLLLLLFQANEQLDLGRVNTQGWVNFVRGFPIIQVIWACQ